VVFFDDVSGESNGARDDPPPEGVRPDMSSLSTSCWYAEPR